MLIRFFFPLFTVQLFFSCYRFSIYFICHCSSIFFRSYFFFCLVSEFLTLVTSLSLTQIILTRPSSSSFPLLFYHSILSFYFLNSQRHLSLSPFSPSFPPLSPQSVKGVQIYLYIFTHFFPSFNFNLPLVVHSSICLFISMSQFVLCLAFHSLFISLVLFQFTFLPPSFTSFFFILFQLFVFSQMFLKCNFLLPPYSNIYLALNFKWRASEKFIFMSFFFAFSFYLLISVSVVWFFFRKGLKSSCCFLFACVFLLLLCVYFCVFLFPLFPFFLLFFYFSYVFKFLFFSLVFVSFVFVVFVFSLLFFFTFIVYSTYVFISPVFLFH